MLQDWEMGEATSSHGAYLYVAFSSPSLVRPNPDDTTRKTFNLLHCSQRKHHDHVLVD